ncbi:hypothetical protein TNCV_2264241 [Trichonephila clavipes]|nr:hypothetical protein TNCV_2264241 [Trichonephila clavipes]
MGVLKSLFYLKLSPGSSIIPKEIDLQLHSLREFIFFPPYSSDFFSRITLWVWGRERETFRYSLPCDTPRMKQELGKKKVVEKGKSFIFDRSCSEGWGIALRPCLGSWENEGFRICSRRRCL